MLTVNENKEFRDLSAQYQHDKGTEKWDKLPKKGSEFISSWALSGLLLQMWPAHPLCRPPTPKLHIILSFGTSLTGEDIEKSPIYWCMRALLYMLRPFFQNQ